MDFAEFADRISFRFVSPDRRTPFGYWTLKTRLAPQLATRFEAANTRLPERAPFAATFRLLREVPRMSTFAIGALLNEGVRRLPEGQSFVNVGVWNGYTFLAGLVGNADKSCIGIDDFSQFGGPRDAFLRRFERLRSPRHEFFDMDYEAYFRDVHRGPIGFYLYDGPHEYEHQSKGLRVAEPHLAKGAVILVDDTDTPEPRQGTLDFVAQSRHRYETILDRRNNGRGHPTWWNGVMMLRKLD